MNSFANICLQILIKPVKKTESVGFTANMINIYQTTNIFTLSQPQCEHPQEKLNYKNFSDNRPLSLTRKPELPFE